MAIDIPMRFEDAALLWTIDDVYSPAEPAAFIARIERSSPGLATDNPIYRDQDRLIVDDEQLAADLFRRLRPHLPERVGPLRLVGLNSRLRMYRYAPGQRFAPHMDHWYRPDDRRITLHSVLTYFNDDFSGGQTRFIEPIERTIIPRRGAALVFQHKLRHEGCGVHSGRKDAMRSELIYEADETLGMHGT